MAENIVAFLFLAGYVRRGGSPTAFDRILATRFGIKAFEMVRAGEWGHMAALRGTRIVSVPLEAAVGEIETAG